jgi:hypothetical protein
MVSGITVQADTEARDAKAIAAAKKVSVHRLDSSLPPKPFAEWLTTIVGRDTSRRWEVNDCGEQTGSGRDVDDIPICAEVEVMLPAKRRLFVSLVVGTDHTGMSARPPEFWYATILESNGAMTGIIKLSQVPAAVRTAR